MNTTGLEIKIAVVDDHKIFRDGIAAALKRKYGIKIIWQAQDGKEMLNKISSNVPDVLLMDIRMPELDGIKAMSILRKAYEKLKIIVLTMYDDLEMISTMMELGANAYLTKTADPDEIYQAILTCTNDDYYFNDLVNKAVLAKLPNKRQVQQFYPSLIKFSEKENRILKLLAEGKSTAVISNEVFLSHTTVRTIIRKMKAKAGVTSVAGLLKFSEETDVTKNAQINIDDLTQKEMLRLFSLSTSILKYVNHDLLGQQAKIILALDIMKDLISSRRNKTEVFSEIKSWIGHTLRYAEEIGAIADLIKSHFYWPAKDRALDLNTLFITRPSQLIRALKLRFPKTRIQISRSSLKSLEIVYPPSVLLSILSELVKNAIKNKKSKAHVLISWTMNGDIFQCEVNDNGPGFSSLKKGICVPLTMIPSKGKGMGLNIIDRTIFDSDGHLFFSRSKVLSGAMVYFEFPVINFNTKAISKNGKK